MTSHKVIKQIYELSQSDQNQLKLEIGCDIVKNAIEVHLKRIDIEHAEKMAISMLILITQIKSIKQLISEQTESKYIQILERNKAKLEESLTKLIEEL